MVPAGFVPVAITSTKLLEQKLMCNFCIRLKCISGMYIWWELSTIDSVVQACLYNIQIRYIQLHKHTWKQHTKQTDTI